MNLRLTRIELHLVKLFLILILLAVSLMKCDVPCRYGCHSPQHLTEFRALGASAVGSSAVEQAGG